MREPRGFIEPSISDETIRELCELSRLAKGDILMMTTLAGSGHPGGSMSSLDIYLVLYNFANLDPSLPNWIERDRIVISHGHTSPGAYSALSRSGFFPVESAVCDFRKCGSSFEGHVDRCVPGIEWNTGNLGQGLSAGCGFALGAKLLGLDYHCYVVMGCGEQQKGQISEARRFAQKYKLFNLTVIIDFNNRQISGHRDKVMPQDIRANYESDGFRVIEIDGHNFQEIYQALREARFDKDHTVAIIAHTIMGKGVSFMEGDAQYHGAPLKVDQLEKALKELGIENRLEHYRALREKGEYPKICRREEPFELNIDIGENREYKKEDKLDNRSAWGNAVLDIFERNLSSGRRTPMAIFDCDLAPSVKTTSIEKKFPDYFFQGGIQEHNTATIAGALSTLPVNVYFADFGVFGIDETFNQERLNDINYTNLKLILTHCGLDVGEDGKTHQCIDYLGLLSNLFGFKVIVPADPNQTDRAVRFITKQKGNWVLAMGRSNQPIILDENDKPFFGGSYKFEYGKMDKIRDGRDGAILTMGTMVPRALKAWEMLKEKGVLFKLFNVSCPLAIEMDLESLKEAARTGVIISYEDHHIDTGLGAKLALAIMDAGLYCRLKRMGIKEYGASGKPDDIFQLAKLSPSHLVEVALSLVS